MIAALFVKRGGPYWDQPGIDAWDVERDARLYAGPWPVVAHPPCARWCRLAGLVEARWGHKRGEDDGCFESALRSVRTWGGVLEHPAYSDAWHEFGLPIPDRRGGWQRGFCGGWSCHVEQGHYGHLARKATWLYAFSATDLAPPQLKRGESTAAFVVSTSRRRRGAVPEMPKSERAITPIAFREELLGLVKDFVPPPLKFGPSAGRALVSWCGNHVSSGEVRPRVGKNAASRTPEAFRDALIYIAKAAGSHAVSD